ncbi:hypothetical protein BGX27_007626, partial [Mortierella sp. AM989]
GGWKRLSNKEYEGMSIKELEDLHETFQQSLSLIFKTYKLYREIPDNKSEGWYKYYLWGFIGLFISSERALLYEPGEATITASALRKNQGRILDGKNKAQGRKADGLILCRITKLEICAFEYGSIDNDLTATKELTDLRKLAKSMKDMYDAIMRKCKDPMITQKELRTFGILISGLKIYIFSLQHHEGRFFILKNEAALAFPSVWERTGNTEAIVSLLCKLLIFRDCLSYTCEKIIQWTETGSIAEMKHLACRKVESSQYFVATLPTPVSSPKISPRKANKVNIE